jgi:hypothetical protein
MVLGRCSFFGGELVKGTGSTGGIESCPPILNTVESTLHEAG